MKNRTRKWWLVGLILLMVLIVSGCSQKSDPTPASSSEPTPTATAEEKTFTLEELAAFDGQNGHKAYVAVDGIVYDVTDVPAWKNGIHQGKYKAGADVTEVLKNVSPHGTKVLEKLTVVGKIK